MNRQEWYEGFRERVLTCERCSAREEARLPVPSTGNVASPIIFVGRNPGRDEDALGEPFVGKAGNIFTEALATVHFGRGDVYITNLNKCFMRRNRLPRKDEVKACFQTFLREELSVISPKVVVLFGATTCKYLAGIDNVTKNSGRCIQHKAGFIAIPCVHPASVCYQFEPNWELLVKCMRIARKVLMKC